MTVGVKVGLSKEQRWDLAVSIQTSRAMTVDMKVGVRNKGRSLRCQRALISEATGRCINTSDPALGDDGGHIQVEVKINCQSRDLWLNYCTIILNYLFLTFCKLYAHRHRPCSLVCIHSYLHTHCHRPLLACIDTARASSLLTHTTPSPRSY